MGIIYCTRKMCRPQSVEIQQPRRCRNKTHASLKQVSRFSFVFAVLQNWGGSVVRSAVDPPSCLVRAGVMRSVGYLTGSPALPCGAPYSQAQYRSPIRHATHHRPASAHRAILHSSASQHDGVATLSHQEKLVRNGKKEILSVCVSRLLCYK